MPPSPSMVDESPEHLAAIRAGAAEAWRGLFLNYFDDLVTFAARFMDSAAAAEDVVQGVFAALWERREHWAPGSIRAYLYGATRNRALNTTARETTAQRYAQTFRDTEEAETAASSDESDVDVAEHFGGLTERQRSVLVLRFERGFTHREIAAALGISLRGAEQLVARAVRTLRERMEGDR